MRLYVESVCSRSQREGCRRRAFYRKAEIRGNALNSLLKGRPAGCSQNSTLLDGLLLCLTLAATRE